MTRADARFARPAGRTCRLLVATLCAMAMAVAAPVALGAITRPPALSVSAATLISPSTHQELYGVAPNREVAIASATKLMTALVTLEHVHRLGTRFTQPDYYPSAVDSQIGLVPGERMSVHDLLLALMLPSADDAAEDLAYNVGRGSVARFVGMMNARARDLGLRHTHYTTPIGLDTPGNYSSAADLATLASYDLAHSPYFARIVALPSALLKSGGHQRYVVNRNDLVGRVPWIDGVKTGHTAQAGYVLVAAGHRGGMSLVSAVLGTASEEARDENTMALLHYGFDAFHLVTPIRGGAVLARPAVHDRPGVRASLIAQHGLARVVPRRSSVRVRVLAPLQLSGPLPRHRTVGEAIVLVDGRPVARVPLLLAAALPAVSGLTVAANFITRPLILALIALLLGAAAALLAVRRRRLRTGTRDLGAA